tara:strand:+ start:157 stop:864 length:708 start_codon:yes stop_codon:yes gene_type:complete
MKKSDLKNYIRENILSTLSESIEDETAALEDYEAKLDDVIKKKQEAGIEEQVDKFNVDVFGYKTKYYKVCPGAKAFMDKVMDGAYGDMSQKQNEVIRIAKLHDLLFIRELRALKDPKYAMSVIPQAEYIAEEIKDNVQFLGIPVADVDYVDNHVEIIKDAAKKINEEDEPSDSDIRKNKSLAKTAEDLALIQADMRSLARKYSKAKGEEKEELLNKLKEKTKLKKELENILDKKL